jgi:hypothetical protein
MGSEALTSRRKDVCSLLLLLGVSLLLWAPRLAGPIDLRYDAGVYYITGVALAEGKGYRLLNEPGEIQAIQYPPLLPAIVAVHRSALGTSDPEVLGHALRWTFFLIFNLYAVAVYAMARQYLTAGYAFLTTFITILYPFTFFLSDLLFAEIPFALAATLFVLCNRKSDRPRYFLLTALCGIATYLLRTAGLALLAAWVTESLVKRNWKQLGMRTAVALLPVLGWQTYIHHVTSSEEYRHPAYAYQRASYQYSNVSYAENLRLIDPFIPELGELSLADVAQRVGTNIVQMPASLGEGVMETRRFCKWLLEYAQLKAGISLLPAWTVFVPLTFMGLLVIAGTGVLLARREWFVPLYLAASLAVISLTPWPGQFTRYLAPVTPFLALALVRLLATLREVSFRWSTRWRWVMLMALIGVVVADLGIEGIGAAHAFVGRHKEGLVYAGPGGEGGYRFFFYGEEWADFDAALIWLKDHAEPGAVLGVSAPHWAYLKTGLKAVMPPMEADQAKAQRLLDSVPVKYVIVDKMEFLDVVRRYTAPVIKSHPELWQRVHTVSSRSKNYTRVYRRVD